MIPLQPLLLKPTLDELLPLAVDSHMGGCQNYGPFLGTLHIRCRIIIEIHKGTIILTTTHMSCCLLGDFLNHSKSQVAF